MNRLNYWRNPLLPITDRYNMRVNQMIQYQDRKGWRLFCFGIVDGSWVDHIQLYMIEVKKKITGANWISKMIRKDWELLYNMCVYYNEFLHSHNEGVHIAKKEAIDRAV